MPEKPKPHIIPVGMWATPTSQEDLLGRVAEMHPDATHAMMFTWNYLASIVNEENTDDGS